MKVAVGVIINQQGDILVTQRPKHVPHGGSWEFPGGKLEEQETAEAALLREIREEIGLRVLEYSFFCDIFHEYSGKKIHLLVYRITLFEGEPSCLEGQLAMRWVSLDALKQLPFPEANKKIISMLDQKNSPVL